MKQENTVKIIDENNALFRINTKIYPKDVVTAAAYVLTDKATILLEGDPEKEIVAKIKSKSGPVEKIVEEFNSELLNYSVYKIQSEKNAPLREAIMKRVLLTNEIISMIQDFKSEIIVKDDPEGIFKTWEEKRAK